MKSVSIATACAIRGAASISAAAALGLLIMPSLPVGAQSALTTGTAQDCPVLQLGNPNPGDTLLPGGYVVSGLAYDPVSSKGAGIQRVDLFLGPRDDGGTILGSTIPGETVDGNARAFEIQIDIPNIVRSEDFIAYAYSSVSSAQSSVMVPINVGAPPQPTPRTDVAAPAPVLVETVNTLCASLAGGPVVGLPAPVVGQPQTMAGAPTLAAAPQPILELSNPSVDDLLVSGGYIVSGVAYDPAAAQGQSGIDSVDLFLDDRDQGGLSLGSTAPGENLANPRTFQTEVMIPAHLSGGHTLFVYAHSSITGMEAVTSVPVFVGVSPPPTPRPEGGA